MTRGKAALRLTRSGSSSTEADSSPSRRRKTSCAGMQTARADAISMHGSLLMKEAQAIEREIQSNRTTWSDPNSLISNPSPFNRR